LFEEEQKMREERLNRQRLNSQEQVMDGDYCPSDDGDYCIDMPETNDEEDDGVQLQNGEKKVLIHNYFINSSAQYHGSDHVF
jgi:hypothetical protein